jgi:hypothetical protein
MFPKGTHGIPESTYTATHDDHWYATRVRSRPGERTERRSGRTKVTQGQRRIHHKEETYSD